jgi:hypothetical protein
MQKGNPQSDLPLVTVPTVRNYYVDESGDPVLFNANGKVIVGTKGCSSHFFMGLLSIFNPVSLENDLKALHSSLLADPKFKNKPSFLPRHRKTAFGFHAKDDLPEVRDLVFSLLIKHHFRFFAVVKDKMEAVKYVRQMNQQDPKFRYTDNQLYAHLISHLFETRLHKRYEYNVYFSKRGERIRTAALSAALHNIQEKARILLKREKDSVGSIKIFPPVNPFECINLQATDYCLWALQRFYVKGEDKHLQMIWPSVSVVQEIDSKIGKKRGITHTRKKYPFKK